MNFNMKALSLLLSGLAMAPAVANEPRWFEVELILFERVGEQTKENFVDTIKQFNTEKSLNLQDNFVHGTLRPCPTLSQYERFSVTPIALTEASSSESFNNPVIQEEMNTGINNATDLNDNVDVVKITNCITPDDEVLRQAYDIKATRLAEILSGSNINPTVDAFGNSTFSGSSNNSTVSLSDKLTNNQLENNDAQSVEDSGIETQSSESIASVEAFGAKLTQAPSFDVNKFVPYPSEFVFNGVNYRSVPKPAPILKVPLTIASNDETVLEHTPAAPYLLNEAHLQMNQLVQKLRWQRTSKPLLHLGWRQPMVARHLSVPVHLFAGKDYSSEFDLQGNNRAHLLQQNEQLNQLQQSGLPLSSQLPATDSQLIAQTPSISISEIVNELNGQQAQKTQANIWQLDGLLNIYLNHYLFIETDFDLRKVEQVKVPEAPVQIAQQNIKTSEPISLLYQAKVEQVIEQEPETAQEFNYVSQLTSHPMKQHRRVRSKDIHYFDHPNMGMIIQIRRYTPPEIPQVEPSS